MDDDSGTFFMTFHEEALFHRSTGCPGGGGVCGGGDGGGCEGGDRLVFAA